MDDLSGLDWSAKSANSKPPPMNSTSSFYPPLRPTPSPLTSGRSTPLSAQGSGNPSAKPAASKPAQDSFSNLINFGSAKSSGNLSLREQQERLEAEKRRKEEERRKQAQAQYGGNFLDSLGQSGSASPAISPPGSGTPSAFNGKPSDTDDDLFAAFNASTKVDKSSYYPPPVSGKASPANAPGLNLSSPGAWDQPNASKNGAFDDDDDPFGLNELKSRTGGAPAAPPPAAGGDEDDDLLGDLGKPVDQVRKKVQAQAPSLSREPEPGKAIEDSSSESEPERAAPSEDPFDKAVAQLVDYGFTPENARRGLTESGAGLNVQAAANWLLDDAHRQAKEKASGRRTGASQIRSEESRSSSRSRAGSPVWTKDDALSDGLSRGDSRSPGTSDIDLAKTAASMGTSLFKTANSLWKTGQKRVQKALDEFQQDGGDPNQPKWMRAAQQDRAAGEGQKSAKTTTEEAMMLESGAPPNRRQESAQSRNHTAATSMHEQAQLPPRAPTSQSRASPVPRWQQSGQAASLDPRTRINKQALEEQSSQAYVSPARRKKTTSQPPSEAQARKSPEDDLLFNTQAPSRSTTTLPSRPAQHSPASTPSSRQSPAPGPAPRPAPAARPPRQIPQVSAIAMKSSTQHRVAGTAHFKRGDYASAHASYSSSLAAIPKEHPLAIVLLCNRALTALKTGEPRQAVDDADSALHLIGPGKGEGEHVELQGDETEKRDMRDLYGKALTRKAEALEQMERWADAGSAWQLCIESGVGGQTATAGRQRCQKALAPKPAPVPRPAAARPRPSPSPSANSDAVKRLRAANAAAEKEGDEKFALADKVDARVAAWRDGKRDNLRALLSSLDNVLWDGSGWKKVGLHELVMANKVKIIYMKAIAKTHPDKIAQDASTEVRMIAGTVFATLNEAWDKFKAENGL